MFMYREILVTPPTSWRTVYSIKANIVRKVVRIPSIEEVVSRMAKLDPERYDAAKTMTHAAANARRASNLNLADILRSSVELPRLFFVHLINVMICNGHEKSSA